MTMSRFATAAAAALCLCLCVAAAAWAAGAGELVQKGDALWEQRGQPGKARQAAEMYEAALQARPGGEEAAWKAARAWYWVGDHAQGEEARIAAFEKGIAAAEKAIEANPDSLGGHYWLGVNYGKYGSAKGVMKSLSLIDPIKEEMNKVIAMDPDYADGGPYRVLGRLYFKVPGLFGGDNDQAIENLQTAIRKGPRNYLSHVYLAEVYLDEGEDGKARALLEEVVAAGPPPGLEAEYAGWKAQAQQMLERME
jgi:tetratricopeptide (TPR) repeat protein